MNSQLLNAALACLAALLLSSCSTGREQAVHQCEELLKRESCGALNGQQVCARIDTNIRCITTPCPSFEFRMLEDSCSACSDPRVSEIFTGSCEEFRSYLEGTGDVR